MDMRILLISTICLLSFNLYSQSRFVDAIKGNDKYDGCTASTAWKSLHKINNHVFAPGDSILFRGGQKWFGVLTPGGSGKAGSPIVIDRFGTGPRPEIHGMGLERQTVMLDNQEYWEIRNLRITNFRDLRSISKGKENEPSKPDRRRGIYIKAEDMSAVSHIHLFNLEVDSVNSENSSFTSRYYGGIFFEITGEKIPTWFEDILVDSCYVHDVSRTGISNSSSWSIRTLNTSFGDYIGKDDKGIDRYDNWIPSRGIVVRRCTLRRIAGNGIIIRVADKPLIENNYMDSCGLYISGNAAFCFNTDSAVFQYNEACYTVYNEGDTDARGIDSDFRTKHTIIQYNYLHHNEFGGVVATGGSGSSPWLETFNDGTIIRYNVLADNKDHIVRTSGRLSNMVFYNNVLYTSAEVAHDSMIILFHGQWGGAYARNSGYYNNIIYHLAEQPVFDLGESIENNFGNNLFFGNRAENEPDNAVKISTEPLLINPGTSGIHGFGLLDNSPAVNAGRYIKGHAAKDFFGNPVPSTGAVDVGIHQLSKSISTSPEGD